ncbi:hypothetical protein F2Q70_00004656 [Brassica cretica]|uniref:Uncharacterized protein n=1 Tax=Brassica cretica TaxID=69181 RepID=A0A8S9IZH8_BRACR|nr:hypothetical protein F2Q70_00004656 [Brassica cretica]KAF3566311.1 hypothetical protein DY000_02016763 [Brassica cretica]
MFDSHEFLDIDPDTCLKIIASCDRYSQELHRRVICLTMDRDLPTVILSPSFDTGYSFELAFQFHRFEVNRHPVAEVMPVLLKKSASREKAVKKRNVCRSMKNS